MDKFEALSKYFGYSSFRGGQQEVIDSILSGRDTLAVMPTRAGKSVCFQIPALLFEGITIVISPLISLMKDQVNALIQNGVSAAYLNRSLTDRQMALALQRACEGRYKIIYVAPERLSTAGFEKFAKSADISMVCVDEAHCVSQWGQDFRPGYLKIADFVSSLQKRPIVCAFTATATLKVREDIKALLALRAPKVTVLSFDRANLYFETVRPASKPKELRRYLKLYSGRSGIIYCSSRKATDKLYDALSSEGYSVTKYHAGLDSQERKLNQELFVNDERDIIIATNAFGMGIDKSNVSFVIHYNMPGDIESYYQEAGRAGRDGCAADCILMFNNSDINTQKYFIENPEENEELTAAEKLRIYRLRLSKLQDMIAYANSETCLRRSILSYFGEAAPENCGNCSVCSRAVSYSDITESAKKVLSCVVRAGENQTKDVIADILKGNRTVYISETSLDEISTFGIMQELSLAKTLEIIIFLIDLGYLKSSSSSLSVTDKGKRVLFGREEVHTFRKEQGIKGKNEDFSYDLQLFARLKTLRKQIASSKSIPAFVVFSDATLRSMSALKPQSAAEFLNVPGVGEAKLDRYGTRFIKEICAYCKEKETD